MFFELTFRMKSSGGGSRHSRIELCVCYSSARRGVDHIMSSSKREFLRTVPRKSLTIFLLGVFLLFSTIGLADDMAQMGRQSALRLALTLLFISTFSVIYATAGFTLRGKSWIAFIPILVVHYLIMKALNSKLPSLPPLNLANTNAVMRLQSRLDTDAIALIVAMGLGYACFVYASITEGRRYFRAHAEIALAQEIHQVLVPTINAKMGRFEFYGRSSPSSEVGGDLIDLAGAEDRWVAYLADVSGHGVAPGVVVGMTKSASRMLLSSGATTVSS